MIAQIKLQNKINTKCIVPTGLVSIPTLRPLFPSFAGVVASSSALRSEMVVWTLFAFLLTLTDWKLLINCNVVSLWLAEYAVSRVGDSAGLSVLSREKSDTSKVTFSLEGEIDLEKVLACVANALESKLLVLIWLISLTVFSLHLSIEQHASLQFLRTNHKERYKFSLETIFKYHIICEAVQDSVISR